MDLYCLGYYLAEPAEEVFESGPHVRSSKYKPDCRDALRSPAQSVHTVKLPLELGEDIFHFFRGIGKEEKGRRKIAKGDRRGCGINPRIAVIGFKAVAS